MLIWSQAGDGGPLSFLVDNYNNLRSSQPELTLEPITEGEITVSEQGGVFGGFTVNDAAGATLGGGLIGSWLCPQPGTAYRLTVMGVDSAVVQIRFDRLIDKFDCSS